MELTAATIEAVKLRLRPIIMTSMAFIFGVSPLALATGAGAQARSTIGFTVLGEMLAATPVLLLFNHCSIPGRSPPIHCSYRLIKLEVFPG